MQPRTRQVMPPLSASTRAVIASTITELEDIGNSLPEANYWGFSLYTIILPQLFEEIGYVALPQFDMVGPIWNQLDAASCFLLGIGQLLDKRTHRPDVTKAKGAVNLLNGTQLAVLTSISFTAFGGISFAACFGVGFVLSLDETLRSIRRLESVNYWLEDSLQQITKLNELISELDSDIAEVKAKLENKNLNTPAKWLAEKTLKLKLARLEKCKSDKDKLEEDVTVVVKSERCKSNFQGSQLKEIIKDHPGSADDDKFKATLDHLSSNNVDIKTLKEECQSDKHKAKEQAIHNNCKQEVKNALHENVTWAFAFVGMLLFCIPGMQFPGLVCVSIASALYLKKHLPKIIPPMVNTLSFFAGKITEANKGHHPLSLVPNLQIPMKK